MAEHAASQSEGTEHSLLQITLRPGVEDEYQLRHDEIWPEMVEALHASGFSEMRIFRHEQTVSIYSVCHPDAATAWARLRETEVNARWDEAGKHLLAQPVVLITSPEIWVLPA
jgi:L-rhamnose mutarotase